MKQAIAIIFASFLMIIGNESRAQQVNITLLQLNDVYEITPVEGGKWGGLARVATVRKQLLKENPNTFTLLAGDVVSPSALGTAQINGVPLAGEQVIAVMNATGLDYATFGNHEFDISKNSLFERLKESKFKWFSGNVRQSDNTPFPGVTPYEILTVKEKGSTVRIGLVSVTLPSNPAAYVKYADAIETIKSQVSELSGKVDVIVALTHLAFEDDQKLAAAVPELDLILGGHEHENIQHWKTVRKNSSCGTSATPIFKADANVRTVYIHELSYDTKKKCLSINSRLQPITDAIPDDKEVAAVVKTWLEKGYNGFREKGFNPEKKVATISEALDGLESSVRNNPTNLTRLVTKAMLSQVENSEVAIFNGGAIRIDDYLPAGDITEYDVIRVFPFGGKIVSTEIKGDFLQLVLNQGLANRGKGGYLQTAGVENRLGYWYINGMHLEPERYYRVVINDFLLTGKEQGLGFLNDKVNDVHVKAVTTDIRMALIQTLKN